MNISTMHLHTVENNLGNEGVVRVNDVSVVGRSKDRGGDTSSVLATTWGGSPIITLQGEDSVSVLVLNPSRINNDGEFTFDNDFEGDGHDPVIYTRENMEKILKDFLEVHLNSSKDQTFKMTGIVSKIFQRRDLFERMPGAAYELIIEEIRKAVSAVEGLKVDFSEVFLDNSVAPVENEINVYVKPAQWGTDKNIKIITEGANAAKVAYKDVSTRRIR